MIVENPLYDNLPQSQTEKIARLCRSGNYRFLLKKEELRESKRVQRFAEKFMRQIEEILPDMYNRFVSTSAYGILREITSEAVSDIPQADKHLTWVFYETKMVMPCDFFEEEEHEKMCMALIKDKQYFEQTVDIVLREVIIHWIYEKFIERPGKITDSNFTILAFPSEMEFPGFFSRFLNQLLYQIKLSAVLLMNKQTQNYNLYKKSCDTIAEMTEKEEELQKELTSLRDENKALKMQNEKQRVHIDSLDDSRFLRQQEAYEKQIHELQTSLKKQAAKLEDVNRKYSALKDRTAILESEAEYAEEDHAEKTTDIDTNSNLLFVCDRAPNSGVQRTYDKMLAAFPNSRISYDVPTTRQKCDAVVLMTRYMLTHAFYWASRDFCKDNHIPCIHCDKQSIERIIDDVTGKRRYS